MIAGAMPLRLAGAPGVAVGVIGRAIGLIARPTRWGRCGSPTGVTRLAVGRVSVAGLIAAVTGVAVMGVAGREVRRAREILVRAFGVSAARGLRCLVAGGDRLASPRLRPLVGSTAGARRSGRCIARRGRGPGAEMATGRAAAVAAATVAAATASATATRGGRGGLRPATTDGRGGQLAGRGAQRSTCGTRDTAATRRGRPRAQLDVAAAGRETRGRRPDVERHDTEQRDEDDRGTGEQAPGGPDADDEAL